MAMISVELQNSPAFQRACAEFAEAAKAQAVIDARLNAQRRASWLEWRKRLGYSSCNSGSHIFGGEKPYRPILISGAVG